MEDTTTTGTATEDDARVPPAVRLVRDFVNTYEPQVDEESVPDPIRLRDWLAGRALIPRDAVLDDADLRRAVAVREGLRQVLLDHAGHDVDPAALAELDHVLASSPVRVSFSAGGPHLAPTRDAPLDTAIAGLLDAIRTSSEEGTWLRLKVCARDTCRWAFYDASRNQGRRWCSMAGCGNFVKMKRAYATRKGRALVAPTPGAGAVDTGQREGPSK